MADYYTKFSIILTLPDQAAVQYAVELANAVERIRDNRVQDGEQLSPAEAALLPEGLRDVETVENWWFDTEAQDINEKPGIWLNSENGGINAVCDFVQHLLHKFDPPGQVTFEWSNDCSKPRTDAYGGGAAVITAKEIKSMNTSDWIHSQTT